jgi:hypothetical protein
MFYEHRVFRINCFKYGVVLSFDYLNSLLAISPGTEMLSDMTSTTIFVLVPGSNLDRFAFQLTEESSCSLQDRRSFHQRTSCVKFYLCHAIVCDNVRFFLVYTNILSTVYSNIYNHHDSKLPIRSKRQR